MNKTEEESQEPIKYPWYKFPLFYAFITSTLLSVIFFSIQFFITIPGTLLIPLLSVATLLLVLGIIFLISVSFYYSFMSKRFVNDTKVLRAQMDYIAEEIEKGSLFKFSRITFTFKLPFMHMETELTRGKDTEKQQSNK